MKTVIIGLVTVFLALSLPMNVFSSGTKSGHGSSNSSSKNSTSHAKVHCKYTSAEGPQHWRHLSDAYKKCRTGKNQSPVTIKNAVASKLDKIKFSYQPSSRHFLNNGHTLQQNFSLGSSIRVGSKTYKLLQLHFHSLSENTVNGKYYDLEVHFVHLNSIEKLAVVGVFFKRGAHNQGLQNLWSTVPAQANKKVQSHEQFDPNSLLPNNRTYFHFMGSLTTPPYSEGVT